MTKYQQFVHDLSLVKGYVDQVRGLVKTSIGDSTNNHRNLTVNQVVRALAGAKSRKLKTLRRNIQMIYPLVQPNLQVNRVLNGLGRRDSYEFGEFLFMAGELAGPTFDRSVRHLLK